MNENSTDDKVFEQLDQEKLASQVADKVKQEAVEAAKRSLIESIEGKKARYSWEEKGKAAPSSYDELFEEVKKQVPAITPEEIDRRVEERLKAEEERKLKQEEESRKKQLETIQEKRKSFDTDWYDLVQQGKMPAPAKEIQERIEKGERLTKDEILSDPGLKARLDLAELMQSTGKSAKLAYYEDYSNKPAGANAPVFGGRPQAPSSTPDEATYDDPDDPNSTVNLRKRLLGF